MIADVVPFGPGEQAILIAPHLREQFAIDFFCCSRGNPSNVGPENGDEWCAFEFGKRNWLGAARKLGVLLRGKKYALLHTWDQRSAILTKWALLVAGSTSRRAVWIHQIQDESPSNVGSDDGSIPGLRRPDWTMGDRWLRDTVSTGEPSTAVPLAIPDTPIAWTQVTGRKSSVQPAPAVKMIGTVCPLEARAGLKHLIWALDQMKCVRDDLRLVVWGTGSQRTELRRYADKIGLLDWIQWRLPGSGVRTEMIDLDFYWQAPRSEAIPPELVAALLMGLPTIAPRSAATLELAKTFSTCLATIPWGARDEMARQTQQWLEHGWTPSSPSIAAEWVQTHAPAVVAREYATAYERILRR